MDSTQDHLTILFIIHWAAFQSRPLFLLGPKKIETRSEIPGAVATPFSTNELTLQNLKSDLSQNLFGDLSRNIC